VTALYSLNRAVHTVEKRGVRLKLGSRTLEFDDKTTPEQFKERLEEALAYGEATASGR
jgi:hypothetical protein